MGEETGPDGRGAFPGKECGSADMIPGKENCCRGGGVNVLSGEEGIGSTGMIPGKENCRRDVTVLPGKEAGFDGIGLLSGEETGLAGGCGTGVSVDRTSYCSS
ncbi:hypothetical protein KSF_022060 [Reticulibacter mediterranei]|uniref:Uncharacterized protein n=1 Tax=Reticulibacter mediterranei TaxID=2778369 RepID=A0A8J3IGK4_9CHLR|nr:hypothetical protein KSF_022060 [Reticulibacter mediterranei]